MNTQRLSASLLFLAVLMTGCGGGGSSTQSNCSLGSSVGCGGTLPPPSTTPPPPPDPAATVGSVSLVASSTELPSAGTAGSEVTITALVKTADNVGVSGATVAFSADSGFLAMANAKSDAGGKVSARLGTGGSKANRPIRVTARVGRHSAEVVVNVTGTHLVFSAPPFMALGGTTTVTASLHDSADQPIAGETIGTSARNGNGVAAVAAVSDSRGQVPIRISATSRGSEEITLSALGATATRTIVVGASDIALTPEVTVDANGTEVIKEVMVGTCFPLDGRVDTGEASVILAASRGTLYRDAACSQPLAGALAVANGTIARSYIRSANAGMSTIDAVTGSAARGSTRLEFVAALLPTSRVDLQSDLSVVGSGERSTLIAVVRDGTTANNLVKGATVQFSILADPSGGNLLSPFNVKTGSDGVARAVFIAGPADGGKDGTLVQARLAELPTATDRTALTVNKRALSIQFGTGNKLTEYSTSVLQQDFAVFVSDSAGNPVKDVTISAAAWPIAYAKGEKDWARQSQNHLTPGIWMTSHSIVCANEDVARKGLYESALDRNGNGLLDPGIPLGVGISGKTDAMGLATVSLRYPRDRADWVRVELTVTGAVAGTESVARGAFWLASLASDHTEYYVSPPGKTSPYGTVANCEIAD